MPPHSELRAVPISRRPDYQMSCLHRSLPSLTNNSSSTAIGTSEGPTWVQLDVFTCAVQGGSPITMQDLSVVGRQE